MTTGVGWFYLGTISLGSLSTVEWDAYYVQFVGSENPLAPTGKIAPDKFILLTMTHSLSAFHII